ncbi:DUF58 domain-containing protein [Actinokineospora iranica]|uniref:Uncharacterized conserved protein, DUF58 family, contains vWF domain n=1 Tax=Actinokineospora iranica TaxID=1271860 RepID=A0A1G6XPH5_9PSEU|nr:DUF58 domain-containing protein [Actinokineospora iranica]SDD80078.1 Uncharacterized conserved protein, DUF58 family, contains vWF domain [Actinokineospora iranica]
MARLTGRGAVVAAVAAAAFAAGWFAGYPVALTLGGAGGGAVLAAVAVVARRPSVTVVREVYPDRVTRGRPAFARIRVRNEGGRGQPGFTASDRIGAGHRGVSVRPLAPGGEVVQHYELPTAARGAHQVGPLTLERPDPLGLAVGRVRTGDTTTLWVYPRRYPMRAPVSGLPHHHHDGATTETAPRGSLDLREIREYVVGDEVRHLHWKASARTGTLMVRDYADPERPLFTALLDTRPGPAFEDAVDIAASLLAASAAAGHRCRLLTTAGLDVSVDSGPSAVRRLLDELTLLRPDDGGAIVPRSLGRPEGRGGCLTVVTSAARADLGAVAALRPHFSALFVLAVGPLDLPRVPGVTVLRAADAETAARRWNSVIAG